ncbi:MAG: HEAT repeat domain-containing protein [bacterium]|nr:HEAT repeat domain-containing protein [bacterium]
MPKLRFTVLSAVLASSLSSQDLERARTLLADRREAQVTEGSRICVEANSVEAVEHLLEVMHQKRRRSRVHLSPGHYRDIAWEGLKKITDHYARRRVEEELKKGKNPRVRQWCAELLGIYGDRGFGATLEKALKSKEPYIVWCAARALGQLKYDGANKKLSFLTHHKDERVRANAIEALARIDSEQFLTFFLVAVREDKDGGVRCALLGAAPEICPDRVEEFSTSSLSDADWRPRMQAVQNLGQIKTKTAVDSLLLALRDGRPIVAARAISELQQLTGQPIQQPDVWVKWWQDNRETFGFPEKRGSKSKKSVGTVAYNGVPVDSDHIAFLIDKSFRMKDDLTSKGMSKEEAAVAELQRVLEILEDKLVFNVFNYDTELVPFKKKPVKLGSKTRRRVIAFASAESDGREKDIWQALDTVVADPTLDTIYLLSSGEPDTGLYVHWNRVTRHLKDLNRFHKVTVHSVAYTDNEWYRDQLQKIAEVTGGHFEWLK